jgi:hypothetical protein
MPPPTPQPTLLAISAATSFLIAIGAFIMAWRTGNLGYGDGTSAAKAAEQANSVANTYAIVGFVMLGVAIFTLVLRIVAKRRLNARGHSRSRDDCRRAAVLVDRWLFVRLPLWSSRSLHRPQMPSQWLRHRMSRWTCRSRTSFDR